MELYECKGEHNYSEVRGYEHGEVSPFVNVSPIRDSDSYAEMWNKYKSNVRWGLAVTMYHLIPETFDTLLSHR
jgi:hypothetical protein